MEDEIIATISTNKGKTYFFLKNNVFIEIDECMSMVKEYGYISQFFEGIPSNIHSSFRYVDGLIYFFHNDRYFVYDEFTETTVETGVFTLDKFKIPCPNIQLYKKFKTFLLNSLNDVFNIADSEL